MIFSAYNSICLSVCINSAFISNAPPIVFRVFAFTPREVQRKVVSTFPLRLASETCCTPAPRAGFTPTQSPWQEQHSFLAWSLPVAAWHRHLATSNISGATDRPFLTAFSFQFKPRQQTNKQKPGRTVPLWSFFFVLWGKLSLQKATPSQNRPLQHFQQFTMGISPHMFSWEK